MILGNKILLKNVDTNGVTDLKTALVSVWEFDETSGTIVNDIHGSNSGNTLNATITAGLLNNCRSYTGNGYTNIPESTSMNFNALTDNFSISMWVKSPDPALTASNVRLLERRLNSGGPYAYSWQVLATTGDIRLVCYDGSNIPFPTILGGDVWDNQWHLITQVVNQTDDTIEAWLDGVFYTSVPNTLVNAAYSISPTKIACNNLITVYYSGLIDQTAMWRRALTQTDHTDLFNLGAGLAYTSW